MKKALTGSVPHIEETIKQLRADRQFSVAYLKAALKELDDKNSRAAGLLALCDVADAYGDLGMVAERNGDSDALRGSSCVWHARCTGNHSLGQCFWCGLVKNALYCWNRKKFYVG